MVSSDNFMWMYVSYFMRTNANINTPTLNKWTIYDIIIHNITEIYLSFLFLLTNKITEKQRGGTIINSR